MQPQWDDGYQPADAEIVKRLAKRMSGRSGFLPADVPDIEQELGSHVAINICKYDHSRGTRSQFVTTVAKNRLLNLIEMQKAKKRGNCRNVLISDAGEQALMDDSRSQDRIDMVSVRRTTGR